MAIPASSTVEQDARRLHSDNHGGHEADPGEMSIGVIIGRTSEFFDFFVFSIACVLVFPARLFPFADPLTGTFYSFGIFALAFLARPFGSLFFIWVDKNYGRSAKLTLALLILGTSTVAMGLVPTYDVAGAWAIGIIMLFRIGQGFALGGAWDGLASLLALSAPSEKRGWYAMIPQLGAAIALAVVTGLFIYLIAGMSAGDFLDWGWRYPFFVAFSINVVALFARLRIVATPEYEQMFESNELVATGVAETWKAEGRQICLGALTPLASFALLQMMTIFPLGYVFLFVQDEGQAVPITPFLTSMLIGSFVYFFATAASGILSDKIGRRKLLTMGVTGIAIFAILAPVLLNLGTAGQTVYILVGFALLGLTFGQSSGAVAASFAPGYRYTASACTSDLAWVLGAGFAPFIALFAAATFGLWAAGVYLLSGAVVTLLVLRANRLTSAMGRN
ncbi:MFS transporter [Falsirhodobacter sp. alg1]|uniref:MFS transporter n=1 Tax=Falsirhodobacter sp. alg1 TaxID=1472418 RepID=UPI000A7D43D6|nr:MFS transporter [Falsirhodobacter sp. alg1]